MDVREAIHILETLMDGVDPVTGEVLPRDHVCQEADVMRALHAAVVALRASKTEVQAFSGTSQDYLRNKNGRLNAGRAWTEQDNQQLISLYLEKWPIEEICRITQRRPRGVNNQLRYLGFDPEINEMADGKNEKKPQTSKHGKPWTHAEHEWLLAAWEEGCTVTEMANHLGRTPHTIRLRLEQYGRYDGSMTSADEPPAWTDADNKELFRMVDAGCTTAEMARRFGRTERAMEARLFYLGLSKKAPKLF